MGVGKGLKRLRKQNNLTMEELVNDLNNKYPDVVKLTKGKISKWENEKEEPRLSSAKVIADYFNVAINELYDEKSLPNTLTQINEVSSKLEEKRQKRVLAYAEHHYSVQQQGENIIYLQSYKDSKTEKVNVNGYVSAGTGETLVDDIEFTVNYPAGVVPPHDFALQINGDSMEPLFEHKEIIFVEENTSINSGQLGVFVVDGEAYVKKVFIYQDHIRLVSLNPKYGDMNFYGDSDVKFAGRVIL
ncbi:XRE family transcriptional regulator [Staphylococcus xylosus]|uniref:XRE family transcriptional regulator n=1 Tax=Staphylococcus xylosus TaxID=1288 RepID=A0A418IRI2_STAXY|nr:XRE family transcriptional regulator [Staphylococcus xylosus]PTI58848.1 transcriptional regulator [Staphylococcus xylosus]RIN12429.1 XRE family transcriptional regulator [Staphylococcus xylosus]